MMKKSGMGKVDMLLDFEYDEEGKCWVVTAPLHNISSQGKTIVEALKAFAEAYELWCEEKGT